MTTRTVGTLTESEENSFCGAREHGRPECTGTRRSSGRFPGHRPRRDGRGVNKQQDMDSSALTTLVAAATEGMRKTQSADEIQAGIGEAIQPPASEEDGHQSDSAVAPTRIRKKGAFGNPTRGFSVLFFFSFFPRRMEKDSPDSLM